MALGAAMGEHGDLVTMRPLSLLIALPLSLALSCKGEDEPPPPPPEPVCGNGLLEVGEECEGLPLPPVGCNMADCTIDPGFSCIPMIEVSEGATGEAPEPMEVMSTCEMLTVCGDGVVDPDEECDDGDEMVADGCSGCRIDPLWTCSGEPSDCFQCGDGFLNPGEECDDGELMDPPMYANLGCENCMIVEGWECFDMVPSLCGPICGDGIWLDESQGLTPGFAEDCDDGDLDPGDGCDATCNVEDDCECTGEPPGTSTCVCGVGDSSGTDTGTGSGTDTGTDTGTNTGGSSSTG